MKRSYPKILRNRKRRIQRRLDPKRAWSDQAEPIIKPAIFTMRWLRKPGQSTAGASAQSIDGQQTGVRQEIDSRLHLLKKHFLTMRATMC